MSNEKSEPMRASALPLLANLHERHPGLSKAVSESFAEAASVALSRHHAPPTDFEVANDGQASLREIAWKAPDERTRKAWANVDDATRDGAYALALASLEAERGLVAIQRAETRTGADYYVGTSDQDLEDALRLEVSGTDHGDDAQFRRRLKEKVAQALAGNSDLPAIACVVGYALRKIALASAAEEE